MNTVTLVNKIISDNSVSLTPSLDVGLLPGTSLYLVTVGTNAGTNTHSSATYGGVSMTRIQTFSSNGNTVMDVFELIHPPSGVNSFAITGPPGNSGVWYAGYAYTNTAGATDNSAISGTATTGSSAGSNLSTVAANAVVLAVAFGGTATGLTPSGFGSNTGSDVHTNTILSGDSGVNVSAGSSVTQSVSGTGGVAYQVAQISIAPNNSSTYAPAINVMNGSSRLITVARSLTNTRAASLTDMVAAGRLMTVVRNWPRTVSVSMMNAAARFITAAFTGASWTLPTKPSTNWTDKSK